MRPTLLRHYQRQTLRRAVRVECQVVREHDWKLIGRSAIDLSTRGMLVETTERVLTGEEVIISFRSPSRRAWYDAQATVARVIHGRRPYDTGRYLGIHFDVFDEAQACALRADLRGHPPPFPKRELRIDYAASVRHFLMH
jgi:hypothetical protein